MTVIPEKVACEASGADYSVKSYPISLYSPEIFDHDPYVHYDYEK